MAVGLLQRLHRQKRRHLIFFRQGEQLRDGLAARDPAGFGDIPDSQPIDFAGLGEHQQVTVGGGDEEVLDKVVLARFERHAALAGAALAAIGIHRSALEVAVVGDGNHHRLVRHQVFDLDLLRALDNLGAALVAELLLHRAQLLGNHRAQPGVGVEDFLQLLDAHLQDLQLVENLLPLHLRQPVQLQIEDGLGLHVSELPALHQAALGFGGRLGAADELDDGVKDIERFLEAQQEVLALTGFGELKGGAPPHYLNAVVDKKLDGFDQPDFFGLAVADGQHDHPEADLHLGVLVEVVEDDLGLLAALELQHDAHALAVAFVADVGDALDFFVVDQVGNLLDQPGLVDLVGNLGDDDADLVAGALFDAGFGADVEAAAPGAVGLLDALLAKEDAGGGEVRPRHQLHNLLQGGVGLAQQQRSGVENFGQVVGRDVGGHADGDARCPVDQQVGHAGGQHHRLAGGVVEIGSEVNRVLLNVGQQVHGHVRQAALGVAVGGGRVAVNGAEVALTVNERVAHAETLRHAHQRFIDRGVTVGVEFLQHLAHYARALGVLAAGDEIHLVHGVEDAAVDGLEAVADVGQGAPDDYAHGVIHIGAPHLLFDSHSDERRQLGPVRTRLHWLSRHLVPAPFPLIPFVVPCWRVTACSRWGSPAALP